MQQIIDYIIKVILTADVLSISFVMLFKLLSKKDFIREQGINNAFLVLVCIFLITSGILMWG